MEQTIVDFALDTVDDFLNWIRENASDIKKELVGEGNTLLVNDVKNLFNALNEEQRQKYQHFADNQFNVVAAKDAGLQEPSMSMSSGKAGDGLFEALEILEKASIKINNPIVFSSDVGESIKDFVGVKGGTDMAAGLEIIMKNNVLENVNKIRKVIYFTDFDTPDKPKQKQ